MEPWPHAELSTLDNPPHSVSSTEVTHNPCSSFIIEMWMRKVRGWLSSIGQHRNIWLSLGRLCQGTLLHCNRGCLFECRKMSGMCSEHALWMTCKKKKKKIARSHSVSFMLLFSSKRLQLCMEAFFFIIAKSYSLHWWSSLLLVAPLSHKVISSWTPS